MGCSCSGLRHRSESLLAFTVTLADSSGFNKHCTSLWVVELTADRASGLIPASRSRTRGRSEL